MKYINIPQGLICVFLIATLWLGGCSSSTQSNATSATSGGAAPVNLSSNIDTSNLPRLEGMATVVMYVNGSPITIEVDGTKAPITAGNFVELVNQGVYDGIAFHRVVREPQPFVVQGGDPQSKNDNVPMAQLGTGGYSDPATGQERYIPLEIQPSNATEPVYSQTFDAQGIRAQPALQHTRGAVAMARSRLPDSASSQFYFALADLPFLDGNYAVFGFVTDGMEVVDRIQAGDRVESAEVTEGLDNLKN
jgi:peptidyl-prolyl cis-trans isomerase B (cyclophilin B)